MIYTEIKNMLEKTWNLWIYSFRSREAMQCTEDHIFFFKCSKKMVFPKKLHWNMTFLVLSKKMIFLFPENMILFCERTMKYDLSQKNTWEYHIFCKCSAKMVFQKNFMEICSFLYYQERWYFFFSKIWSYSLDGKQKIIFLK